MYYKSKKIILFRTTWDEKMTTIFVYVIHYRITEQGDELHLLNTFVSLKCKNDNSLRLQTHKPQS